MTLTFYTYIHSKPDGMPFYVGKGVLKRTKSLNANRNPYYLSTVEKYGAKNIIINKFECASEANAFELEMFVIETLKEKRVKLTNFTDGGEGVSGMICSAETRTKISNATKGKTRSEETRNKMSAWQIGRTLPAETKAKISTANKGTVHSEEYKVKMSILKKGKPLSAEARKNMSLALIGNTRNKGKIASLKSRAKMSESQKGKPKSAEHRQKLSDAKKGCIAWNKGKTFKPLSDEVRAKISASLRKRYKDKK